MSNAAVVSQQLALCYTVTEKEQGVRLGCLGQVR